jgi:hypothetical protein
MKSRETWNLVAHFTVAYVLAALVCWNFWFVVLATFIYAWLREQGQHRWVILTVDDLVCERKYNTVYKQTFFGWMTWHRIWEVFQWTFGAATACGIWQCLVGSR